MAQVVLVALGPNRIEIPCRLFRCDAQARRFCNLHFDIAREEVDDDGKKFKVYLVDDLGDEGRRSLMAIIFTFYYGGCGEVWGFTLRPAPFDRAFVGFDLD